MRKYPSENDLIWNGKVLSDKEIKSLTGIETICGIEDFPRTLKSFDCSLRGIGSDSESKNYVEELISSLDEDFFVENLTPYFSEIEFIKDKEQLRKYKRSVDIAAQSLIETMKISKNMV